jgi:phospholipase C
VYELCGPVPGEPTFQKTSWMWLLCLVPLLLLAGCGSGTTGSEFTSTLVSLTASPTTIAAGGSAVLTAQTTNATQLVISGSDGSHYTLSAGGGTQTVSPTVTTIYTATATGSADSATATATVTVSANPATVTLTANPATIAAGGSSVLTATAANATQVVISGSDGSHYTLAATGGTQTVSPTATTTYTATATGTGGGTATAMATVTVSASAATVTLTASPTTIAAGSSSVLTAIAANATQVVISGSDGSHYTLAATGGTQSVSPTATTTYTATATGPGGSGTAMATVAVSAVPATVTLTANPTTIASGSSSVLTAIATNATQVVITGSDGSHYTLAATGGTQSVSPTSTTTYTATASGTGGNATAMATVTVSATSATVTLTANPTTIAAGSSSVLTAIATNATQVVISGSDGSHYTLAATGGTQSVSPTTTTTYTATATGPGGSGTAMATVTVTSPASVTLSANPTSIASGASSVLTATATNATQVVITGSDGSHYTLAATGGTQSVSPTSTTTYTATATGTGGNATAMATVTVTASAATVTLSANPTTIVSGNSSVLTATATNATQVTIVGSDGSHYTLSASGGTQTVSPASTTTYTATATGAGGNGTAMATVTVTPAPATVTLSANPTTVALGSSSVLTATATNATQVVITGSDGSHYTLAATGGTQTVSPTTTTTYTATATSAGGNATAMATVTVVPVGSVLAITHVIFMLQENHSFDNYFGMLNPYRAANNYNVGDDGKTYNVDGIDDKLTTISNEDDEGASFSPFKFTSTCVDDMTSSWLESYGDVSRYDFSPSRPINMDGFVHTNEDYGKNCQTSGGTSCAGSFTDFTGVRAMGYYDQGFLNYYYYMASQFALSDRWFSPVSSKSIPNRIATFTGGTTQGLVFDPGDDDHLSQLQIPTIFAELTTNHVSWKIYYTVTQAGCLSEDDCPAGASNLYPATDFSYLTDSYAYLYENPTGAPCTGNTQASSVVGDTTNSFCIDPTHIAPLSTYYTDLSNGTLPSFSFIEAGYGVNDEHPGSGQSILAGQQEVATVVNALMGSTSWLNSVFFMAYDEGGGPYDHVPPVPGASNQNTDSMVGSATVGSFPDISTIAVNADTYFPCPAPGGTPTAGGGTPTVHCDLVSPGDPGYHTTDAPFIQGFAAQLGFRLPNMVISPYSRRHYVSHIPMDHTAILKFVESRFINSSAHLTARDAAQPNLLDFFDFTAVPWAVPPTPPTPVSPASLGHDPCTPTSFQ